MSFDSGRPVEVRGLDISDYFYEKVWLTVYQIADPLHPLGDVYAAHCSSSVHLLLIHQLYYAYCMIMVMFSSIVNPM